MSKALESVRLAVARMRGGSDVAYEDFRKTLVAALPNQPTD